MSQVKAKATAKVEPKPEFDNWDASKHPVVTKPDRTPQSSWDVIGKAMAEKSALSDAEDTFVKANKGKASDASLRQSFELKDGNDRDDVADAQKLDKLKAAYDAGVKKAPIYAGWLWAQPKEKYGTDAVAAAAGSMTDIPADQRGQLTALATGKAAKEIGYTKTK